MKRPDTNIGMDDVDTEHNPVHEFMVTLAGMAMIGFIVEQKRAQIISITEGPEAAANHLETFIAASFINCLAESEFVLVKKEIGFDR